MRLSTGPSDDVRPPASTRYNVADLPTQKTPIVLPITPAPESVLRRRSPSTGPLANASRALWQRWYAAFKHILPVYIAIHLALVAISCFAFLFINKDFSSIIMPVSTLWDQWRHWDSGYYLQIAMHGYTTRQEMAFFPFYPILIRAVMVITRNELTAGLIVSNAAELVTFTVLYRLIEKDFDENRAYHTILYFAIFPTAFFFSAAYTESLFLCLSTLTFYQIRRGRWGFAALFGFMASLTRPDGMFLIVPFCYEYLARIWQEQELSLGTILSWRQIFGCLQRIRFDVLLGLCIPASIVFFVAYGRDHAHDPLAFVHAHAFWDRSLYLPGWGILKSIWTVFHHGLLSFLTMRTSIDLSADLFILALVALSFVGPWKLPKNLWGYGLYALALYTYFQLFPKAGIYPLESMSRFLLEIFPAFIILSSMSKYRTLHLSYCMVSAALLFFLLTQFLTGHWVL